MTTVNTEVPHRNVADDLLRDYHDARRREDQWRIPQLLLALVTPVLALITVLLMMGGQDYADVAGALTVITGIAAALLAVEVWRWHRTALGLINRFRTEHSADFALLMKDPI